MQEVKAFSMSHLTTLAIENLFNAGRDLSSKSRKGSMSPANFWHNNVFGSSVMKDFDLAPTPITASARACATKHVPESVFRYTDGDCSIEDQHLDHFCSTKPDWASPTPEGMNQNGVKWQLALAVDGDWSQIEAAYVSALAQPGWVLLHVSGTPSAHLVLRSSRHGCLVCRTPVAKRGATTIVHLTKTAFNTGQSFLHITDLEQWRAAVVEPLVPAEGLQIEGALNSSVALRMTEASSLLCLAAKHGFRGLTAYYLKKLFDDSKVRYKGPKPRSEVALMTALVRHALPTASDDVVAKALEARQVTVPAAASMASPIFDPKYADLFRDEEAFESEDIKQEYVSHMETVAKQQARDEHKRAVLQEFLASGAASASSGASGSGGPAAGAVAVPGGRKPRKFNPRRAHGYSRDAAADLVPPGCKITKDMKENRWKISAPWMATTKSKSWGTGTQLDDYDAMKFVILVAWSVYTEQTGEPCPHEFAQGDCVAQAPAQ